MNHDSEPVTKKELDEVLDKKFNQWTHDEIVPVVGAMFEKHREETKKDIKESENRIVASNDKLAGDIKKDHEEFMATIMSSEQAKEKHREYDSKLDNHDRRIKALEANPA